MAVVLTYPEDPGQLGMNAAGVVAAFTATGYQNEGSGLTVTITDETLGGRILGSGSASTAAEPSGIYAGWWAFSVSCPAFDSTGASIVLLESAEAFIAAAASLRAGSGAAVSGTASAETAATETAEGYTGGASEVVLSYADGSARLRATVGDLFSGTAADATAATVSGGGPALIDDFSTNTIASYTRTGGQASGFSVTGGRLQSAVIDVGDASEGYCIRTGSSLADGVAEAKLRFGADWEAGETGLVWSLLARYGDASNFIAANLGNGAGLQAWQVVAGVSTQIGASYALSLTANTDYTVRLTMTGGNIIVALNGVDRVTGTTTRTVAGSYGFKAARSFGGGDPFYTLPGTMYADDLTAG